VIPQMSAPAAFLLGMAFCALLALAVVGVLFAVAGARRRYREHQEAITALHFPGPQPEHTLREAVERSLRLADLVQHPERTDREATR
jgi:hypothetical protein